MCVLGISSSEGHAQKHEQVQHHEGALTQILHHEEKNQGVDAFRLTAHA